MIFSVVIPAYNCEKTIAQTVQSISDVNLEDMEIIIIDDGSTDGTRGVCGKIIEKNRQVKYCYQNNAGVSSARNYGVSMASGKFIILWDSDDKANTELLKKCMLTAQEKDTDMLIFGMVFRRMYKGKVFQIESMCCSKEELIGRKEMPDQLADLFDINYLSSACNKILKKDICDRVSFNTQKKSFEDLLFILEYLKYCNSLYVMSDSAYIYEINYSSKKPPREKQINDFIAYMSDFQYAIINLEKELSVELPELRGKLGPIYDGMLRNKLESSSIRELKSIDTDKMEVTLFGEPYTAKTRVARWFFKHRFFTIRLYHFYRRLRGRLYYRYKCKQYNKTGEV